MTHVARATATIEKGAEKYRVGIRSGRHEFVGDEPPSNGGEDQGPSPFALLLSGLASCTAITLRMYAERKQWPLTSVEVDARYEVNDKRRTILRTITLSEGLDADQRQRLAEIAEKTPVTLAVRAGTPIATAFV